jgi:hypothetical protein
MFVDMLSLCAARLVENRLEISPQMRETLAYDLTALLCLGKTDAPRKTDGMK